MGCFLYDVVRSELLIDMCIGWDFRYPTPLYIDKKGGEIIKQVFLEILYWFKNCWGETANWI
jgi:hypothetical protein